MTKRRNTRKSATAEEGKMITKLTQKKNKRQKTMKRRLTMLTGLGKMMMRVNLNSAAGWERRLQSLLCCQAEVV